MAENIDIGANWEGLVKTLLNRLEIPTKSDINALHLRLDKLEQLIYQKQPGSPKEGRQKSGKKKSASAVVYEIIGNYPDGAEFKTIKAATRFEDKKLRNIIFRLDKIGKIEKIRRGVYRQL